jgi:hypothetical protein
MVDLKLIGAVLLLIHEEYRVTLRPSLTSGRNVLMYSQLKISPGPVWAGKLTSWFHVACPQFGVMFKVKAAQTALRRSIQSLFSTTLRNSTSIMGAAGVETVNTTQRLAGVRELMAKKEHSVQALVVPSEDQREFK